jgi:hypothetical protein
MRPELRGVLVEKFKGGGVYVVGCDGARLRRDYFGMQAAPGLYDVRSNSAKGIVLEPCKVLLRYPNYRKVVPASGGSAYSVSGKGSRFVLWAAAALGACVDPKLMALGDDETMDIFIQKEDPGSSPLMLKNNQTLMVVMPVLLDAGIGEQLAGMQLDRLRRQRKMAVVKPRLQPKPESVAWWPFRRRKKAA